MRTLVGRIPQAVSEKISTDAANIYCSKIAKAKAKGSRGDVGNIALWFGTPTKLTQAVQLGHERLDGRKEVG